MSSINKAEYWRNSEYDKNFQEKTPGKLKKLEKLKNYDVIDGETFKVEYVLFKTDDIIKEPIDEEEYYSNINNVNNKSKTDKYDISNIDLEQAVKIFTVLDKSGTLQYCCAVWNPIVYLCKNTNNNVMKLYKTDSVDAVFSYRKTVLDILKKIISEKKIFETNLISFLAGETNQFITISSDSDKNESSLLTFVKLFSYTFSVSTFNELDKKIREVLDLGIEESLNEKIKEINLQRNLTYDEKEKKKVINYISKLRFNACFKSEFLAFLLYKISPYVKRENIYKEMKKKLQIEGDAVLSVIKYEALL